MTHVRNFIIGAIVWLVLTALFGCLWYAGAEHIPATDEECKSADTLAQAVLDRDLKWYQVLICTDEQVEYQGFDFSVAQPRKEN